MFVLFLSTFSQAAEYYNTDSIAANSKLFRDAQSSLMPIYSKMESDVARWEEGLRKEELSVYLLNDPELIKAYEDEKRQFTKVRLQFEERANYTIDSYSTVFMKAVDAELTKYPDAVVCSEQAGLLNMDQGEDCQGENISTKIAAEIDKNEQLENDIKAINATPWPVVNIPQDTVNVGDSYVNIHSIAKNYYGQKITLLSTQRDLKLQEIVPGLQSNDSEEKKAAISAAKGIHDSFHQELATIGTNVTNALSLVNASTNLCTRSAELGGCEGANKSLEAIELIDNKRKARKWVSK